MTARGWAIGIGVLFVVGSFFFMIMQLDRINVGMLTVGNRLTKLEADSQNRMADPAAVASDLTALRSELQALRTELAQTQGRIAGLEASNQVGAVQTEVAALHQNFASLQQSILLISQQIAALLGEGQPVEVVDGTAPINAAPDGTSCAAALDWRDAAQYAGQETQRFFGGPVVAAIYNAESPDSKTVFHIGSHDAGRLEAWISAESRANFSEAPEVMFANQTICISGAVVLVENDSGAEIATIEITSPDQIAFLQ